MLDSSAYSLFEIHYEEAKLSVGHISRETGVARIIATTNDMAVSSLKNMLDNPSHFLVIKTIVERIDRMVLEV